MASTRSFRLMKFGGPRRTTTEGGASGKLVSSSRKRTWPPEGHGRAGFVGTVDVTSSQVMFRSNSKHPLCVSESALIRSSIRWCSGLSGVSFWECSVLVEDTLLESLLLEESTFALLFIVDAGNYRHYHRRRGNPLRADDEQDGLQDCANARSVRSCCNTLYNHNNNNNTNEMTAIAGSSVDDVRVAMERFHRGEHVYMGHRKGALY